MVLSIDGFLGRMVRIKLSQTSHHKSMLASLFHLFNFLFTSDLHFPLKESSQVKLLISDSHVIGLYSKRASAGNREDNTAACIFFLTTWPLVGHVKSLITSNEL
jgi:hypothetical protein